MKNFKGILGSQDRFGYEWSKYSQIIPEYEKQFLKWVFPLNQKDFAGKRVLDAGCGIGRNSYWPLKYGAKEIIAFDYDKRTVRVAKRNLAQFNNAGVFYKSIYDLNYKDYFDISFSIGVIHHLEDPKRAVYNIVKATKSGGKILIWVYGYEGNEWIIRYINPIRKITSKLPVQLTHKITHLFSIPFYMYIKNFSSKNEYLRQLSGFKFFHVHSIIFDQLIPKIANYWKRDEALSLFDSSQLAEIKIFRVNKNSWTVIATKK